MKLLSLSLAAAALLAAAPALAQFAKPEDAVKYRQGAFYVMGQHFSRIGAMASGRVPYDMKLAVENAEIVAALARLPSAGFVPATASLSQRARPEIWAEQARFGAQNDKLAQEAGGLLAAAKTNDLSKLKAAFGSTAAVCKSCHDAFRSH
jgi:cytochrome c556